MALIEVNRGCSTSEHAGNLVAIPMRHLGGAMEFEDIASGIVSRDGAARFEWNARMPADGESGGNHVVGRAKCRADVAITLAHDGRLGRAARLELAGGLVRAP